MTIRGQMKTATAVLTVTATVLVGLASGTATASQSKKSTIVIGQLSTITAAGVSDPEIRAVSVAWQDWTNAHGGIAGHQVKVIVDDDAGDPGKSLADMENLVLSQHVVAVDVAQDSGLEATWAPFASSHTIAVLGAGPYQPIWNSTVHLFPTDTTIVANLYGYDAALKAGGATKVGAVYCTESAACSGIVGPLQAFAKAQGLQWVYSGGISSTAPNYTASCLAAQAAGVNGIALAVGYSVAPRIAADCAQQGYHPLWIFPQSDPSLLKSQALNGAYGFDLSLPYFLKVPQLSAFHAAMSKYAHGQSYQSVAGRTWGSYQVLAKALAKSAAAGNPTPQDALTGMYSLPKNYTAGGILPPLNYVNNQPAPAVSCFFLVAIKSGKYVAPNGTKPTCQPTS